MASALNGRDFDTLRIFNGMVQQGDDLPVQQSVGDFCRAVAPGIFAFPFLPGPVVQNPFIKGFRILRKILSFSWL
jgi:hypothetical protein